MCSYLNFLYQVFLQHGIHCLNVSLAVRFAPEMELVLVRLRIVFQEYHLRAEGNEAAFLVQVYDRIPFHIKGRIVQSRIIACVQEGKIGESVKVFTLTIRKNKNDASLNALKYFSFNGGHFEGFFHLVYQLLMFITGDSVE